MIFRIGVNYLMYLFSVVCVLSGGNVDPLQLSRGLQRGLAAFGRLIRFSVSPLTN